MVTFNSGAKQGVPTQSKNQPIEKMMLSRSVYLMYELLRRVQSASNGRESRGKKSDGAPGGAELSGGWREDPMKERRSPARVSTGEFSPGKNGNTRNEHPKVYSFSGKSFAEKFQTHGNDNVSSKLRARETPPGPTEKFINEKTWN